MLLKKVRISIQAIPCAHNEVFDERKALREATVDMSWWGMCWVGGQWSENEEVLVGGDATGFLVYHPVDCVPVITVIRLALPTQSHSAFI